jgi:isoleucyl-tRNA synthetase
MRRVIELVRVVRDKKNIPVKTPLREVVVINADVEYLEDVRSLENYISEELNVKSVIVTDDEVKYGVKYRADPDSKGLGQRLKKDLPPLMKALKELPSDTLKEFLVSKKMTVLGHELDENDVKVSRFFDEAEHPTYDGAFDRNALVLVDVMLDEGLILEGMAREVVNRVQRLRKKVGRKQIARVVKRFLTRDLLDRRNWCRWTRSNTTTR